MVVFVDLDDENEPPEDPRLRSQHWSRTGLSEQWDGKRDTDPNKAATRDNPNKSAVTEALGCYPYASLENTREAFRACFCY